MKKYGCYFPIHTIYDIIPTKVNFKKINIYFFKEKESLSNMFTVLLNIMRKTERDFKKIKTFNIFKMNPFYFKGYHKKI